MVLKAAAAVSRGSICTDNDNIHVICSGLAAFEARSFSHSTEDLSLAKNSSAALYTSCCQQDAHLERSLARNDC